MQTMQTRTNVGWLYSHYASAHHELRASTPNRTAAIPLGRMLPGANALHRLRCREGILYLNATLEPGKEYYSRCAPGHEVPRQAFFYLWTSSDAARNLKQHACLLCNSWFITVLLFLFFYVLFLLFRPRKSGHRVTRATVCPVSVARPPGRHRVRSFYQEPRLDAKARASPSALGTPRGHHA